MKGIDYILKDFNRLKKTKESLESQLKDFKSTFETIEKSLLDLHETIKNNEHLVNSHDKNTYENVMEYGIAIRNFPKTYRKDIKIKWIIEKYFNRGVRLSDISEAINTFNGQPIKIDNVVRRLKKDGILSLVKYNKSNKLGFWGLSDWIDENGFSEKYMPMKSELPLVIKEIEIVKKQKASN